MPRHRTRRLWMAVLFAVAGVGLAGGAIVGPPEVRLAAQDPGDVTVAPTPVGVAVLPARNEVGKGGAHLSPGRSLLPLVALVALAGLAVLTVGRSVPAVAGHRPLVARRHFIALRAPPSLQLV